MRSTELFDDYLGGRMAAEDRAFFESRLNNEPAFAAAFAEHKALIEALRKHEGNSQLKKKLEAIHYETFGRAKVISMQREQNFASRHGKTMVVAASTAFIAVMGTVAILSTGGFLLRQQSNEITELKRNVMELKSSSEGIVEGITKSKKIVYAPANLEGTAFALNNKGYLITSYHMVRNADSIFIQNSATDRTHAALVLSDPALDLAILKIENKKLISGWQVPFSLKEKPSEIGEKVFTLGYPRREMVYGEGALSSLTGYSNDTSMYQISIPVNPGNSGGPLLDENGYIIGVVRGKITGAEATGFAIKAINILNTIKEQGADSLHREILSNLNRKPTLKGIKRSEQVKKINPYVFNVLVYNKE
jgi:serine protease Do